jgi:hypothetical protein
LKASASPAALRLELRGWLNTSDNDNVDLDGTSAQASLHGGIPFGDRVALALGGTFRYRNIEEANIYQGDAEIGLPILILAPQR